MNINKTMTYEVNASASANDILYSLTEIRAVFVFADLMADIKFHMMLKLTNRHIRFERVEIEVNSTVKLVSLVVFVAAKFNKSSS